MNHVNEFYSHTNLTYGTLDGQDLWSTNNGGDTDVNLWEEEGHQWKATVCPLFGESATYDLGTCRGPRTALDELNRQIADELRSEYTKNQELLEQLADFDPIGIWTDRMEERQREIEDELELTDDYDFDEHHGHGLTP